MLEKVIGLMARDFHSRSVEYFLWIVWLGSVVLWNYHWATATPFDDVFVTVCLVLFLRSMQKGFF